MFSLTEPQKEKLKVWRAEQDAIVAEQQRENNDRIEADESLTETQKEFTKTPPLLPYYGVSAGELTYCFTPTTIGLVLRVQHAVTGAEIDLTDYDMW